jgi:integrase
LKVLAETGMRIGEVIALEWGDVDADRIHVRRRYYRGRLDTPKSRYGVRSVPITPELGRALWQLRAAAPSPHDVALVFPNTRPRRPQPNC